MFKDVAGGEVITEFVGLRAKLYVIKKLDEEEEKRYKGAWERLIRSSCMVWAAHLVGRGPFHLNNRS